MKHKRDLIFLIPAVLLVGVLCYAGIRALGIYIPQQREQAAFASLKDSARQASATEAQPGSVSTEPQDQSPAGESGEAPTETAYVYPYAALQAQNPDFVGWLTIEGTEIDYPVMKSAEDDPEYYLRRDFYGNDSSSGCLFVGGGCDIDSESFIVYGHNMNNDAMFGTLDEYADYDYAVSHLDLHFTTATGERVYRVFSAFQTRLYTDRDDVFEYYEKIGTLGEEDYTQTVEVFRTLSIPSLPYAPVYPAQLLILSTCSYHTDNGRFVVVAYRIS